MCFHICFVIGSSKCAHYIKFCSAHLRCYQYTYKTFHGSVCCSLASLAWSLDKLVANNREHKNSITTLSENMIRILENSGYKNKLKCLTLTLIEKLIYSSSLQSSSHPDSPLIQSFSRAGYL